MKLIIYPINGGIAVMYPTGTRSDEETALKDVPTGVKFKYIEKSDLPDRDFRNAWEFDFTTDFDGVGA